MLEDSDYYNDNINGKWYKKPEHIREVETMANDAVKVFIGTSSNGEDAKIEMLMNILYERTVVVL